MSRFGDEIETKMNSTEWGRQIAHSVILKRKRKAKKVCLNLCSLIAVILLTVGITVTQSIYKKNSWENQLLSTIFDYNSKTVFSREIDKFIEEFF